MIWNPFKANKLIQELKSTHSKLSCDSCIWIYTCLEKTSRELKESQAVNIILKEQVEKLYQEKMDLHKENDRLAQKHCYIKH